MDQPKFHFLNDKDIHREHLNTIKNKCMKKCSKETGDGRDRCYSNCVDIFDFQECMSKWRGGGIPQCTFGFGPKAEKYGDDPEY